MQAEISNWPSAIVEITTRLGPHAITAIVAIASSLLLWKMKRSEMRGQAEFMPEHNETNGDPAKANEKDNGTSHAGLRWVVVTGGVVFVALLLTSIFLPNMSERVKFFTANALSVSILVAIVVQAYIYRRQWQAMRDQADITRSGLEETRRIVAQNERAVAAAEESAKIARESFHIGEAPYFGIPQIAYADFDPGYCPRVIIAFLNGGKTPAWHVHSMPEMILGEALENGEHVRLTIPHSSGYADVENTFSPSGTPRVSKRCPFHPGTMGKDCQPKPATVSCRQTSL